MTVQFAEEVQPHLVDIESISEFPDNPRRGDIDALVDSIKTNGFYSVGLVQKSTGYLVAGNHRRKALMKLGADKMPVIVQDMSDEDARRIVLGDNRTSDLAYYDDPTLFKLLDQLEGDFSGTGYDKASFELLLQSLEGEEILGGIAQGYVPEDRMGDYLDSDIRSIILPYAGDEFDEVARALIKLRDAFGYETNSEVVRQLIDNALDVMDTD